MKFHWLRRLFQPRFKVEDEVRRIMETDVPDAALPDTSLPELEVDIPQRDTEADDRTWMDLAEHMYKARTVLHRHQIQAALRKRHGYPQRGR